MKKINLDIGRGEVLEVPILNKAPVVFEPEVTDFIQKHDGEIMLYKIRNIVFNKAWDKSQ